MIQVQFVIDCYCSEFKLECSLGLNQFRPTQSRLHFCKIFIDRRTELVLVEVSFKLLFVFMPSQGVQPKASNLIHLEIDQIPPTDGVKDK